MKTKISELTKSLFTRTLSLAVIAAVLSSGCCTITGKWTNRDNEKWDPACFIIGNFIFGGIIGMAIDLLNDSATINTKTGYYQPAPENHPERLLAVHLDDGRFLIIRGLESEEKLYGPIGNQVKRINLPTKHITRTEWVIRAANSES